MDNRVTVEDIRVIEAKLNDNPPYTWSLMFDDDTGMPMSLQIDGLIINKRKFVIYYKNGVWHAIKCRDEETCLNINLANYAMVKGWRVEVEQFHMFTTADYTLRQPEVRIFDRHGMLCRNFRFIYMDIITNVNGTNFIIPSGPIIEHPIENETLNNCTAFATGRFNRIERENERMVVMNNINDLIIESSGRLYIDTDGISFESAYSNKREEIASTAQMIELYGNDSVRKIWNYINTPATSAIEGLVKEQMKKILTEGDDK